jgi:hypothetical protein
MYMNFLKRYKVPLLTAYQIFTVTIHIVDTSTSLRLSMIVRNTYYIYKIAFF